MFQIDVPHFHFNAALVRFFFVAVLKYIEQNNLKKEAFIVAYSVRLQFVMLGDHSARNVKQLVTLYLLPSSKK